MLVTVAVGSLALLAPSQPLLHASRLVRSQRVAAAPVLAEEGGRKIAIEDFQPPKLSRRELQNAYAEESRKYRRTVYMHDEWVKHRSSERIFDNMLSITKSGVSQNLGVELTFVTFTAIFAVLVNCCLIA